MLERTFGDSVGGVWVILVRYQAIELEESTKDDALIVGPDRKPSLTSFNVNILINGVAVDEYGA